MGMFDSVYVPCPKCGARNEFQTKAGECYLEHYTPEDAPTNLLLDIINEPAWCGGCQTWFALIDPAHPPVPPRPQIKAIAVRYPRAGEYWADPKYPDRHRWWQAPFTYADLIEPPPNPFPTSPPSPTMRPMDFRTQLRSATEDTVQVALESTLISLPLKTEAEVLEAFNRMLDLLIGEDEDD